MTSSRFVPPTTHATDIGRSLPPSFENAGEGGTKVSSVSAIDTGWYTGSGTAPEPGIMIDDVVEVGFIGIRVILPGFILALTLPARLRNMYTNAAATRRRITNALSAMTASIAGRYELSFVIVLAMSSETLTEPLEEEVSDVVLAAL